MVVILKPQNDGLPSGTGTAKRQGDLKKNEDGDVMVKTTNSGIIVGFALGSTAGLVGGPIGLFIGGSVGTILGELAEHVYLRRRAQAA